MSTGGVLGSDIVGESRKIRARIGELSTPPDLSRSTPDFLSRYFESKETGKERGILKTAFPMSLDPRTSRTEY